jgi:hypothetical protein
MAYLLLYEVMVAEKLLSLIRRKSTTFRLLQKATRIIPTSTFPSWMVRYRYLKTLPTARQGHSMAKKRSLEVRKQHTVSVDRPVKLQACIAYTVGEVAESPCDTCAKGHGVFPKCVAVDGFFKKSYASRCPIRTSKFSSKPLP